MFYLFKVLSVFEHLQQNILFPTDLEIIMESLPIGLVHQNQVLVVTVIRVLVRIPVMTLVSLSKTLNYNCFSPPRGKWIPVRAEMVLVIDLA